MAHTIRAKQTMRGLDRCPPRPFRKARATRPERYLARRVILAELLDRPAPTQRLHMPYYT